MALVIGCPAASLLFGILGHENDSWDFGGLVPRRSEIS